MWEGWEFVFPFIFDEYWHPCQDMSNLLQTCRSIFPVIQQWCAMQLDMLFAAQGGRLPLPN